MADARDLIPPIPTITLDQCEQLITEVPNIYTAMLGVDPKTLPSDEHVGRLALKRVEIWHDAAHELERVWEQIDQLFGSSSSIPCLPECEPLPITDHEATTRQWLDRNYCQPALTLLKSIASRVRQGVTDGLDPWFVKTLSSVGRIWYEHEKHRSPRESIYVDTAELAEDISHNAGFHHANASHTSPDLNPESTALEDQQIIEKAQKGYKDPRVDIEYIYDTPERHHSREGGLPCLVIECKSAHKLTANVLEKVLHNFDLFCRSPSLQKRWRADGSIPVRSALYADNAGVLDPAAIAVLGCLVQLYHAMLRRRQTFGMLTSIDATLLLKIDWSHATEAGQRVLVATLAQPNAILKPCSKSDPRRWTPFHVIVALTILQLEQGLRPEKDIDNLCKLLWSQQMEYQLPLDRDSDDSQGSEDAVDRASSDPVGSGGRTRKTRRTQDGQRRSAACVPSVTDAASTSVRTAQQQQQTHQQQQQKVSKHDNDIAKLLASAGKARPELEKLVALEEHGGCLSVDPHELGRLLCAIFPLVSSTETQRKNRFAARYRINHPRYIHSSLELLRPQTLEWGPVPSWLNRRLAITDDPKLARLMADEKTLLFKRGGANLGRSGGDNGDNNSDGDGSSNSSSNDKSSPLQHNDDSEADSSSDSLGSAKESDGSSSSSLFCASSGL